MDRTSRIFLLGAVAFFLSACVQTKDEFTVNPDGTGKVIHEVTLSVPGAALGFFSEVRTEEMLELMAKDELNNASAVEAWRDVSYHWTEDNRFYLRGTAYFRDIQKVAFYNGGDTTNTLFDQMIFAVRDEGLVLELRSSGGGMPQGETQRNKKLSEFDIQREIERETNDYKEMREILAAALSSLKKERIFRLPGRVHETRNFQSEGDGGSFSTLTLVVEGQKILGFLDKMITDEMMMREFVSFGEDLASENSPMEKHLNKHMFGEAGTIRAVIGKPQQDLFDYEAEMKQARIAFQETVQRVGWEPPVEKNVSVPAEPDAHDTGTVRVDLGLHRFENGARGAAYRAIITEVKAVNAYQQSLTFSVWIPKDRIKAVHIYDAQGRKLPVTQGHVHEIDRKTILTMLLREACPQQGKIILDLYKKPVE